MEKTWLVKSSGRIIGPLSFDDIVQGLKSKEYVVLDEVAKPFGRWRYLRDEEAFEKIINDLKGKDSVHSESTVTGTLSFTESTTEVVLGTHEKTVHILPDYGDDGKEIGKAVPPTKVFGFEPDPKKWNRILSLVLVLIVVTIAFFYTKEKPSGRNNISYGDTIRQAQFLKSIGDYEGAKLEYLNARNIESDDDESALNLAALLIYFQDTVTAERMLTQVLKSNPMDQMKKIIFNYLGMIQLFHFDSDGGKQNFEEALKIDPNYVPALFNLGMTQFMDKNFKYAGTSYLKSIKNGGVDAYIYVMLVNAFLEQIKSGTLEKEKLNDLIEINNIIVQKNPTQFQEQSIAYAYVLYRLGNKKDVLAILEKVLDSDPDETTDHDENLDYFKDKPIWHFLTLWLKDMSREFKSSGRVEALLGYSYFKNKERVEGKNLIDHALRVAPNDILIQAMSSYTASVANNEDEAVAILNATKAGEEFQLPYILKARHCMAEANVTCADESWRKVQKINPESLTAYDGLAQIALMENNVIQAKKYVDKGLLKSPTYEPLLKLKKQIDEKN